jgi:hypothetical protein
MSRELSLNDYVDKFYQELFDELDSTNRYNAVLCRPQFLCIQTFRDEVEEEFRGKPEVQVQQIRDFVSVLFERRKEYFGVDELEVLPLEVDEESCHRILQISPPDNEFPQTLSTAIHPVHPDPKKVYLNIVGFGKIEIFKNRNPTIGTLQTRIMLSSGFVNIINYLFIFL